VLSSSPPRQVAQANGRHRLSEVRRQPKLLNPDISLIGDSLAPWATISLAWTFAGAAESEIGLQATSIPISRADAFLSFGETV